MPVVVATGHPLVPTIEYCILTKPRGMLKYFVKLDTALAMALDQTALPYWESWRQLPLKYSLS